MSATSDMPMGSPHRSSTGGRAKLDDEPRSIAEVRSELEARLADLRERRRELEMSDDRCHTNGRIAEIDRQISDVNAKIKVLGTEVRDAPSNG